MTKFSPDPNLYPFQSNWVDLADGSRIHYVDEGTGPVLLLLHGNPAWSFLYRKIIPTLSENFRCIAPDLPGFGLSTAHTGFGFTAAEQAAVIVNFVDHLELEGMGVMMQDWGGPIGLHLAQSRPERVDRLIIGNTFGWPFKRLGPRLFSVLMGGFAGRIGAWTVNGVVRWFFTNGVVHPLSADVWAMYHAPFAKLKSRRPTHIFPKQLVAAGPFLKEVEDGLSAISHKPALILWGDKDFAFKADERARFRQAFPDHRDVTLKDAGHFIQEDAPDKIIHEISHWYATVDRNN